jgi:hypothetical protein
MFAVIYRGFIKQGTEDEYKNLWRKVATYFIQHRGALGSCLHKTQEGEWIAYSRWPDKQTRDSSWPREGENPSKTLSPEIQEVILKLKECIDNDQPFQEICMDVVDDLILKR